MDDTVAGTPPLDELALPGFSPASPAATPYRVLARKYRPRTFDDLIGQEAMVRTLSNGFETGRIPQAWMLTGVRGVGKTTTARILARGLNYQRADGTGQPTVHMPELGIHCESIMESRHVDVLEMDAASHTGIEDVRQIIDGIRYAPVSARYKVYIIDEVHMLSEKAFNAFLKTLEEPPPHAKFVFATTEIRKVPVTILSRCQRFDLRRVEADVLVQHLERICRAENVTADEDALAAIARAAEGSVRDSLSLLDQAIAHGAGTVTAAIVRDMLGLADRGRIIDLFEAVMRGDIPAAFAALRDAYDAGADPAVIVSDLAAFTHVVTRLKLIPDAARDPALTEIERVRGASFAERLTVRALSRAWQILLKGLPEVQGSNRPVAAAEMLLVRLAYASDLPTPDEALRALSRHGAAASPAPSPSGGFSPGAGPSASLALATVNARPERQAPAPAQNAAPVLRLRRFEDVVALAGERREISLKTALERDVRLVRFEEGQIEFALAEGGNRTLANDLSRVLQEWTGVRWVVALAASSNTPTLYEQQQAAARQRTEGAANHPLVQAVLSRFPGAQIVNVVEKVRAADDSTAETDLLGTEDAAAARELETDDDL
ncbi:DNA polymerase III subunit gamma/tau [Microvirga massiliensis]|uniref:DNA polymerase III subunit gamma/tau n=1 Tax=Microvirga massiliensis TaxID=1033741 RepID=UPI00062B3B9E|nr:DNA polymerase III subunit gamma/tau [Microvirga massiliensis]